MPGARSHFKVYKQKNPNNGGGCMCSPHAKLADCQAPFIVATHTDQAVSRNPYVVIGAGCVARMAEGVGAIPDAPEPERIEVPVTDLSAASVADLSRALTARLTEDK